MMLDLSDATWDFYSETLGRSVIPDEDTFARFVLEPSLYVEELYADGLIAQKDDDGFVRAVCMIAEEEYTASLAKSAGGMELSSESLGDYSYSVGSNTGSLSVDEQKSRRAMKWLRFYCYVVPGVM